MRIEQNEVYEVWTMFISGVFQTTRDRHCFSYFFFSGLKIYFRKKNPLRF